MAAKRPRQAGIAKRIKSAAKVLYTVFFNCDGPRVQISIANGKTITGKFYKNGVLSKEQAHYEKRRPATSLRGLLSKNS